MLTDRCIVSRSNTNLIISSNQSFETKDTYRSSQIISLCFFTCFLEVARWVICNSRASKEMWTENIVKMTIFETWVSWSRELFWEVIIIESIESNDWSKIFKREWNDQWIAMNDFSSFFLRLLLLNDEIVSTVDFHFRVDFLTRSCFKSEYEHWISFCENTYWMNSMSHIFLLIQNI